MSNRIEGMLGNNGKGKGRKQKEVNYINPDAPESNIGKDIKVELKIVFFNVKKGSKVEKQADILELQEKVCNIIKEYEPNHISSGVVGREHNHTLAMMEMLQAELEAHKLSRGDVHREGQGENHEG